MKFYLPSSFSGRFTLILAICAPVIGEQRVLPRASCPLTAMSDSERASWSHGKQPDGSPNWPRPWLATLTAHHDELMETGVIPASSKLGSPEEAARLIDEFYRDWGDEHANAQWQAIMLNELDNVDCVNGRTAEALAELALDLYSEGLASTGPMWMGGFAAAIAGIHSPAHPELPELADDLFEHALSEAAANGNVTTIEFLNKERARSSTRPRVDGVAPAGDSIDPTERVLRTAGNEPVQADQVAALLLQLQAQNGADDLRSILRRLRAVSVVLQRSRRTDTHGQAELEDWLLSLAESPRWKDNRTLIRAWSRCTSAMGRRASKDFCERAAVLEQDAGNRAWREALRAVAVRCESDRKPAAPSRDRESTKSPQPAGQSQASGGAGSDANVRPR